MPKARMNRGSMSTRCAETSLFAALCGVLVFAALSVAARASLEPEPPQAQAPAQEAQGAPPQQQDAAKALLGREAFEDYKCATCHGVAAADIEAKAKSEKLRGPDLSGYTTDDTAALNAYLRKQSELNGVRHKHEFKGSDEELELLLGWLGILEQP